MSSPVIAVDAMGGDFGPSCTVSACISSLREFPDLRLILVGHTPEIEKYLRRVKEVDSARLQIVHASEQITMEDSLTHALRGKPDSSMRVALEQVRDGKAQACVSGGNTAALMALSRMTLKTLPGIDRPAMVCALPTLKGYSYLLDLGANVDCTAEHLFQFAVMGAVAAEVLDTPHPRVALLNIGSEANKGNQQVKQAAALLEERSFLNYTGFVEGDGFFRGEADVVVCDGFVGNVLLKSCEGLVGMLSAHLNRIFNSGLVAKLNGAMAVPLLHRLKNQLSPSTYNGASFIGLQGIVLKSHGNADAYSFQSAIRRALVQVSDDLPRRLHGRMERLLGSV